MIPFQITDWNRLFAVTQNGASGQTSAKTVDFETLKIREVEHSANYEADHWCTKGHIVYCLEGDYTIKLSDGSSHFLSQGMSFQVSDNLSEHKTFSEKGVKLLIIDGDFLK